MSAILLGVLPVFAMIALGWGLKASKFIPEASWPPIERLTYFVFYPGFLMPAVWKADFGSLSAGPLGIATVGAIVIVSLAVLAARPLLRISGPSYTSVFQGSLRWNTFVFLPLAALVFGPEGAGLGAMIMGALIPAINVICVLVMSRWGDGQGGGWRTALRGLAQNPVLWGCGVGALFNVLHVPQIPVVMSTIDLLSTAALTMGLVVAGAGLNFGYVHSLRWLITSAVQVHRIRGNIDPENLQKALSEALGTPWLGDRPEKAEPEQPQQNRDRDNRRDRRRNRDRDGRNNGNND